MNKTNSENESVSGKNYKKKLQEELFAQSNGEHLQRKERKRKFSEEPSACEPVGSPKKNKIKRESESDIDLSTKYKTNGHYRSECYDSYDESHLNLKVKDEQHFATPSPTKTKKKRSKSKSNSAILNEVFCEAKNKRENLGDCIDEDTDGRKQNVDASVNRSGSFNNLRESVKRTPTISERIQFEEDESSDVNQRQTTKTSTKSSNLNIFLKENLNLKPFPGTLNAKSVLTVDDDVWIVTCPKEVDVDAFENKEFTLEGKCKLKLNGQTYEGTVDNESGNMSMLSSEQSTFVIKTLLVKGCLNFRKRIPKSHIQDDVMLNNQTNFIPLPETKCRHPLFGTGYRRAIRLPASVAGRLHAHPGRHHKQRGAPSQECSDPFIRSTKAEFSSESSVKPEFESDQTQTVSIKKNKKKRKHSYSKEALPRETKRIKHNLESAEAWESEQAIEENLFNF
ncbi:Uncharacterized protein OBRU01_24595, partial [Operophtera brumata]